MKKILKRLGVLAAATLVAALVAEFLVLAVLGEQVKFPRHVVGTEFGVRRNLPGADYRHKSADISVRFRINQQGMRADRDFAYEKPPGTLRILSLGDSFTIGYEVESEDCFSSVLERELRVLGYNVEVLNAGVSGYSTAEACLYLERELIKYDPDLVLVSFYSNDIRDNVRSGLFDLAEDGSLVQKQDAYVPMGDLANYLNTSRAFSLLSQYSNAFSFAKNEITNLLKDRMVETQLESVAEERGIDIEEWNRKLDEAERRERATGETDPGGDGSAAGGAGGLTDSSPSQDTPEQPKAKRPEPILRVRKLACKIYERIYDFLEERNIPLVVHSIPYLGEDKETGELVIIDTFPFKCFDFRRDGVSIVYSKRVLDPLLGEEQLYWLRSNRHWTPRAHDAAGRALAAHIHENGLLPR